MYIYIYIYIYINLYIPVSYILHLSIRPSIYTSIHPSIYPSRPIHPSNLFLVLAKGLFEQIVYWLAGVRVCQPIFGSSSYSYVPCLQTIQISKLLVAIPRYTMLLIFLTTLTSLVDVQPTRSSTYSVKKPIGQQGHRDSNQHHRPRSRVPFSLHGWSVSPRSLPTFGIRS